MGGEANGNGVGGGGGEGGEVGGGGKQGSGGHSVVGMCMQYGGGWWRASGWAGGAVRHDRPVIRSKELGK